MGLTDAIAGLFLDAADAIRPAEAEARWLSIGTIDYYVSPELLSKHDINPPGSSDSKQCMAHFVSALGYPLYEELDINERADIRHDLNYPIPDALHERYDLVWDCGSVEHVMNSYQANKNLIDLVRVGGIVVCQQGIGDQTNAGYWTISPNFYLDFLTANGFEILEFILFDRRGHTVQGVEVASKGQPVGQTIPLVRLPGYYLRTVRADVVARVLSSHALPTRAMASLEYRLPSVARVANAILGRTPRGGPDWIMLVIGRKTAELPETFRIQNVYR